MFEADAETFRQAGIRIGADQTVLERSLFEETLAPFPLQLRNEALRMGRLYVLLHCFENSVKRLIKERLEQAHAEKWWVDGVQGKIRSLAESRKGASVKNSWLQGESADLLSFIDFGNLSQIMVERWELFSDLIPSQHWLKQRFDELEKALNFIAHSRSLSVSEFSRIEMYIADWNAQVGL
ncbi:Swt1 family HEPN domain-containing protein [Hansschlegelia beijingensis]|uniref:Swt1 family HEPN domain-containing protein n=1 Tax=Hansschlegelia beijingensis TaxID=1133344 RepID=UPI00387F05C9